MISLDQEIEDIDLLKFEAVQDIKVTKAFKSLQADDLNIGYSNLNSTLMRDKRNANQLRYIVNERIYFNEVTLEELKERAHTSKVVIWQTLAGMLLFFASVHYSAIKDNKIDMEVVLPIAIMLIGFLIAFFIHIKKINSQIRIRSK